MMSELPGLHCPSPPTPLRAPALAPAQGRSRSREPVVRKRLLSPQRERGFVPFALLHETVMSQKTLNPYDLFDVRSLLSEEERAVLGFGRPLR